MSKLNGKPDQSSLITQLEKQQKVLKKHIDDSQNSLLAKEIKHNAMVDEYELTEDKLEKIKQRRVINVSDHAVLRYIERVLGMDIEALKESIVDDDMARKINAMGNGNYGIRDGYKLIVRENVVLTVLKKGTKSF